MSTKFESVHISLDKRHTDKITMIQQNNYFERYQNLFICKTINGCTLIYS